MNLINFSEELTQEESCAYLTAWIQHEYGYILEEFQYGLN